MADPKYDVEAQRLVSLQEAAKLMSISYDTLARRHRDKFVKVSSRRFAMRLADVLHPEVQ